MIKIPVLMYHSIQGRNSAGSGCDYEIKEEDFETQIRFLKKHGFCSVLFGDIITSKRIPEKGIVITFDDGHLSNYTIAFPLLLKMGFKAEFFITPDQIGASNRMNVHHLKEMVDKGMAIGSHGLTHAYLDDLDDLQAKNELKQSRGNLSNIITEPVISFSAPGGRFRRQHIEAAQDCGYQVFCTSRPGFLTPQDSLLNVPRIPVCSGDVSNFRKIVNCNSLFYAKKRIVACVLGVAKKTLGNRRYENVRDFLRH